MAGVTSPLQPFLCCRVLSPSQTLQEVATCSYLAQVCSQLLCPDSENEVARGSGEEAKAPNGVAVTGMGHTIGGVRGILQELEGCFPPK